MAFAITPSVQTGPYFFHLEREMSFQPLDYSTPSPSSQLSRGNQPQEILDLCVRRNVPSPPPVPSSHISPHLPSSNVPAYHRPNTISPQQPSSNNSPQHQPLHISPQLPSSNIPEHRSSNTSPRHLPTTSGQHPFSTLSQHLLPKTPPQPPSRDISPRLPATLTVKVEHSRIPSPPFQPPVTILQQQLMQHHPPVHTTTTTPDFCSPTSQPCFQQGANLLVSSLHQSLQYPIIQPAPILNTSNSRCKPTRPFKAYPKDPLSLSLGVPTETLLGHGSNEAYTEFRRRMLEQVQVATSIGSNSNKSRSSVKRPLSPDHPTSSDGLTGSGNTSGTEDNAIKDAAYWERRRKNNEAAKRSRDARRAKEDEIAIRAAFLEQENMKLKYELAALRNEAAKLRCMVYNS